MAFGTSVHLKEDVYAGRTWKIMKENAKVYNLKIHDQKGAKITRILPFNSRGLFKSDLFTIIMTKRLLSFMILALLTSLDTA